MASFTHGGNVKEICRNRGINSKEIIDFSANINPIGLNEKIKNEIINNIYTIEKYPDITYFELRQSIVSFENENITREDLKLNNENIVLGNGAAEVLFSVVRGAKPKKAIVLAPTFSEYEEALESVDAEVNLYYLKEENNFELQEDILDWINEEIDMIFICNPNNPTGNVTKNDIIIKILEKSKITNTKVVIDESFLDFLDNTYSVIQYIKKYDNLIIIKSLTKVFAIPGVRIGYSIINNDELIKNINKNIPAWNINCFAEVCTKAALNDKEYLDKTKKYVESERDYLFNQLKEIEFIKVYKPSVNFIFFKVNKKIDLKNELLNENILIRSCSNYNGLNDEYYRIAVRTHEENKKLIEYLRKILN